MCLLLGVPVSFDYLCTDLGGEVPLGAAVTRDALLLHVVKAIIDLCRYLMSEVLHILVEAIIDLCRYP